MAEFDAAPDEVKAQILGACGELLAPFRATGKVVVEEGLQHASLARTIRPQNGQPTVSDGPFLNVSAQLGSVFIVEADSLDEAVQIASLHPAAHLGEAYGFGIEVRPAQ